VKFCTAALAFPFVTALFAPNTFAQNTSMPKTPASLDAAQSKPAAEAPVDPKKVILTIGSTTITAEQYNGLVDALPQQYQAFARGAGKRQFAENLVQLTLLAAEADKKGLDKDPLIAEQLAVNRKDILARAMFESIQKDIKVDDALIQTYYDAHKNEYESVRAKHILIRVKGAPMPGAEGKPELTDEQALAKAQEVRKKLVAGGDFAALAKTESDDTGSAQQGGDLGEFRRGMMVPPFEQAAFTLKPGEISEPVKSPFGYHIIVVTEHKLKTLPEVRADIEKAVRPEIARKAVEDMRRKTAVKIDDGFFGPAPAAEPAAPTAPVVK
jgi:peptidyl-prolyl cis-trans isomerase C